MTRFARSQPRIEKIVARCEGTSKNWLSKYVVDIYLNILLEKFNLENNSQKFGALNCNDSACILESKVKRQPFLTVSF